MAKSNFFIIIIFVLILIVFTFPLFLHLTCYIPGFSSTDEPLATLWNSWLAKYSFTHHLPTTFTFLFAYPFGIASDTSGFVSYLWKAVNYFLSITTSPVLNYNIQVLFNSLLSAVCVYFLVLYLAKSRLGAVFSAIAFTFCPYQFARAWQHLGLTYNQWIPLILFSAILLKDDLSRKRSFFFLLSLLLVFSFDFSIMYLAAISLAAFFIYVLLHNWRIKIRERGIGKSEIRFFKNAFLIGIFAFIVLLPQFAPIITNRLKLSSTTAASVFNPYHRPFEDLFEQSARPLSYLLPATTHPVFGKFTEQFIGSKLYGTSLTEHTLYLGWIPLILAFIAFLRWKKDRKKPRAGEDHYFGFFLFLALFAWLFSQPPWWKIGPVKIWMPSFLMYKILPMYRAYCRFGIVLMLAVAVTAGFGLKFILERFKTKKARLAVSMLFCGLLLFEFWNYPPFKVIDVSRAPQAYSWLKAQAQDFAIAEYPLDCQGANVMYMFYQTKHEKKMINGTIPGTKANDLARTITRLSSPETARMLAWMGVKYVLVHYDGYLQTELIKDKDELETIPKNKGLKLVRSFPEQECLEENIFCTKKTGKIDVYEVVARIK
ncbi:MAG: hypothetical protein PHG51_01665 [Candidatus Omnitrophica bacterium]|nr:hypothetical protein [Candidatus Omnitrophota bacterium]